MWPHRVARAQDPPEDWADDATDLIGAGGDLA